MYDKDFKVSSRYSNSTKALVNAAIANFNESNKVVSEKYDTPFSSDARMVMEHTTQRESVRARYQSFVETVRSALVTEALYKIFSESVDESIREDATNRSIMRAIVSQYVHENDYNEILSRMKTASAVMSEVYNTITDTVTAIKEATDQNNPTTFMVTDEMKDEFFKQLDYSDSEAVSDAIRTRVSDAMQDFVTANTKDHEDITATLQQAQEKIASIPEDDTQLREYYEMKARRQVNEIRNAPKSVLHSMISAMCESVLKNQESHAEFLIEGHLDMDKIVTRTSMMYTFMEMLNTARIEKIDQAFIESVIKDLSE